MPRISRFKLKEDDRTGFKQFEIGLIKDGPWKVMPEEYDVPPPSRIPLGGEGDVAPGESRTHGVFTDSAALDTPVSVDHPTVYVTAAGGITPVFTHPWMYVVGSNAAITISATPQIAPGLEGQVLTLACVGSSITLSQGTGVNFMNSQGSLQLDSGSILTLVYHSGGTVWNEASRSRT